MGCIQRARRWAPWCRHPAPSCIEARTVKGGRGECGRWAALHREPGPGGRSVPARMRLPAGPSFTVCLPGRSVRERRKPKLRRALWSGWSGWSSGNGRRPAVGLVACPRRPCCPQGCRRRHRGPAEGGPMVPILLWDHWDHWDGGSCRYLQRIRRSSVAGWRRKRGKLATEALQAGDESVASWRRAHAPARLCFRAAHRAACASTCAALGNSRTASSSRPPRTLR